MVCGLTKEEIKVIIGLIDDYQFDGCAWGSNGIWLNDIKKKLYEISRSSGAVKRQPGRRG